VNLKAAVLLFLVLTAFSTVTLVLSNISIHKIFNVSRNSVDALGSFVQPCGDPVDGDWSPN